MAEAEYITLAAATQEATWMRQLLEDLHSGQIEPTVIYEDNQPAICIAQNPQYHNRTKHIDIMFKKKFWIPLSSYGIVQRGTW